MKKQTLILSCLLLPLTLLAQVQMAWTSKDKLIASDATMSVLPLEKTASVKAWRGERVGLEAVVKADAASEPLSLRLKAKGKAARQWEAKADFLGWVLTDSFNTCGNHPDNLPPYLVPDIIGGGEQPEECRLRPVWCTLEVPYTCKAGRYEWQLEVVGRESRRTLARLPLRVEVVDRTLPRPQEQQFHLDYWQQPYSVSRFYNVPRWSQQHYNLLRPYLQLLARAGQKVVTTVLFYEPWGAQSNDKFDAMVRTTREKDGTWSYDYSVFDHYVELCDSCGINKQINCFSMVPWDMTFRYFDAFSQQYIDLKAKTDSPAYQELWTEFLKAFARHLKEKGWFEKTCIAMDERGEKPMRDAWNLVQQAVPGMKMAMAGHHTAELAENLYDFCIGYNDRFTEEELRRRHERGMVSTTYICCSTKRPNTAERHCQRLRRLSALVVDELDRRPAPRLPLQVLRSRRHLRHLSRPLLLAEVGTLHRGHPAGRKGPPRAPAARAQQHPRRPRATQCPHHRPCRLPRHRPRHHRGDCREGSAPAGAGEPVSKELPF